MIGLTLLKKSLHVQATDSSMRLLVTGVTTDKALSRLIQRIHTSFKTGEEKLLSNFKG